MARRGQRLGRRTLGKEGVAIPLGASKIATHPTKNSREGPSVEPEVATRGQLWLGASEDLEGPYSDWNWGGKRGEAVRVLTWAAEERLGAHHPSSAARGPGWGAAAGQGVEGGLPGHILGGRRNKLRP